MGMFDSVMIRCPKCGEQVEFQSKAGPCNLERYDQTCVPIEVAKSIEGDSESCGGCGHVLTVVTMLPQFVPVFTI